MIDDQTAIAAMGEALIDQGLMTRPALDTELATMQTNPVSGSEPSGFSEQQPADSLDSAIDAAAFAPPARAEQYDLALPMNAQLTVNDAAEVSTIKEAFYAVGLPASIVAEFARQHAAAAADPPGEAQRASTKLQTMQRLRHMHGENTETVLAVARSEFAELTARAPSLRDMADRSGLSDSVFLVNSLWNNARAKQRG
jgi:hypothetical protein